MRGEVEVWSGDELILKEANMLTDGAGELLADIMTVSPSLATISDPATQAILDTSNYTIQAISFGTGSDAFRTNAHNFDGKKISLFAGQIGDIQTGQSGNIALLRTNREDGNTASVDQPVATSVPISPDPALKELEINTNCSSIFTGPDPDVPLSSVFPGNGQLTNFLLSPATEDVIKETQLSSDALAYGAASILGCFPEGSSVSRTEEPSRVVYYDSDSSALRIESSGGYFNEVSSMDISGFVTAVSGTASTSGLTTSSNASFATNGTVEYAVTLSRSDALFAHAYGGIFHLGLWTINIKESLLNGNTPPFGFSVLDNPRKYRLFCRKGVSKDLTYIEDVTAYEDLTIKWRLHFL